MNYQVGLHFCKWARMKKKWIIIFALALSACDGEHHFAPVVDVAHIEPLPYSNRHIVTHGESLYEIAWRYGLDYRSLARQNGLEAPYVLFTGQKLILKGTPLKASDAQFVLKEETTNNKSWLWPVAGRIVNTFSDENKGVNIAKGLGAPILASESGTVVYAGNGLRGYGNLIIIKHNNVFLSAYAHNRLLFVKEGDFVKRGQKIAEMGNSGTNRVMLHFEIRKAGKPINPLLLIQPS